MVKLPIELTEYTSDWEGAVAAAVAKRQALAKIAAAENATKAGEMRGQTPRRLLEIGAKRGGLLG